MAGRQTTNKQSKQQRGKGREQSKQGRKKMRAGVVTQEVSKPRREEREKQAGRQANRSAGGERARVRERHTLGCRGKYKKAPEEGGWGSLGSGRGSRRRCSERAARTYSGGRAGGVSALLVVVARSRRSRSGREGASNEGEEGTNAEEVVVVVVLVVGAGKSGLDWPGSAPLAGGCLSDIVSFLPLEPGLAWAASLLRLPSKFPPPGLAPVAGTPYSNHGPATAVTARHRRPPAAPAACLACRPLHSGTGRTGPRLRTAAPGPAPSPSPSRLGSGNLAWVG